MEVGQFYDGGCAMDVYISGIYAYMADREDGLEIIDISDPTTPVEVGQIYDGGETYKVYISGIYAYMVDREDGLEIIDISDPTSPVEVGQFYDDEGYFVSSVYISGSYVNVASSSFGLKILDISDPTAPVEVAQFNDDGSAVEVYVSGNYAYVADYMDGLEILHVTGGIEHNIAINVPVSLSSWMINFSYYINWESTGYISTVNIELYRNGVFETEIASDISNDGSYCWTLPLGLVNATNYQIKITEASNSSVYDYSENFEIYAKFITVTNPDRVSISGYNPFLFLIAMIGISVILVLKKREKNLIS